MELRHFDYYCHICGDGPCPSWSPICVSCGAILTSPILSNVNTDPGLPDTRFSRIQSRSLAEEHQIQVHIGTIPALALADTCSTRNLVSERFMRYNRLHYEITHSTLKKPDNTSMQCIGNVSLDLSLGRSKYIHSLTFAVVPYMVKDIVLGSKFIKTTNIFGKLNHLVKWVPKISTPRRARLFFTGQSRQIVSGYINDHFVSASPDTGSEVNIVSKAFAITNGLLIDTSAEYVINLEFIDGSTTPTHGIIRNTTWSFGRAMDDAINPDVPIKDWEYGSDGTSEDTYICDFYVLDGLTTPIILSVDLLLGSNAFKTLPCKFSYDEPVAASPSDVCYVRKRKERPLVDALRRSLWTCRLSLSTLLCSY
jgi:hypothetical protein